MNTATKFAIPLFALVMLIPLGINAYTGPAQPGNGTVDPIASTTDAYETLESLLAYYENVIPAEDDTEQQQQAVENMVIRIGSAKALYDITHEQAVDEEYADMTVSELITLFGSTYAPDDITEASIQTERTSGPQSTMGRNMNLVTHHHSSGGATDVERIQSLAQKQYDCDLNRRAYGQTTSTYTSYTNGHAKITTDFNYPEDLDKDIRTFRNNVCTDFDHDETSAWHSVIGVTGDLGSFFQSQSCRITTSDASTSKYIWCNAFGQDRISLTVVFNTYDASGSSKVTQLGGAAVALIET